MNKLMDNLQFQVYTDILKKSSKGGKRRIQGYASTAALDRQGEVISIEALRQAANHLLENQTVFYEHEHAKFPVGKVIETAIDDKGLLVEVEISQTADQLWTLIEEEILDSFSIGGRVISAEEKVGEDNKPYNEITGIELFEVSVVGLPANPEAKFKLVNKSFSMAIAEEIKKRKEDSVVKKEIKKVEEVKVEPTKKVEDKVKVSEKPKEEKKDALKKDLERYEKEDKEAAKKSQEAKPEEIVEDKTKKEVVAEDKKVVEGEKVEEQKEIVKGTKETKITEEKVAEAKSEATEVKVVEPVSVTKTPDIIVTDSEDTSTIQINLLPIKTEVSEVKEEKCEECGKEKLAEEKTKEEPETKVDNSIVTDEELEKLVVTDISKPYPNEHAARIRPVSDFQEGSFRSQQLAEGLRIIIGRLIGEKTTTTQAYRFHVDHFTAEEAKQWLKDHDVTYILFEPAKKEDNKQPEKKEEVVVEAGTPKLDKKEKPVEEKVEDTNKPAQEKTNEAVMESLNRVLGMLGKLVERVTSLEAKLVEKTVEKPKVEEKKEEPKVEKTKEKAKEKPQRKSFIVDAPYASDKKDEKKKTTEKTTDKGWTNIIYRGQK